MIATVKMRDGRTATLENDGTWSADTEALAALLNSVYSPLKPIDDASSQVQPWFGHEEAERFAKRFGATVTYPAKKEAKDKSLVF